MSLIRHLFEYFDRIDTLPRTPAVVLYVLRYRADAHLSDAKYWRHSAGDGV
jgi:hypothetical protein